MEGKERRGEEMEGRRGEERKTESSLINSIDEHLESLKTLLPLSIRRPCPTDTIDSRSDFLHIYIYIYRERDPIYNLMPLCHHSK